MKNNTLITATDYSKLHGVPRPVLLEIIKFLALQPEQTIGNAKMYSVELFDRIVEAIKTIPLDKNTKT